MCVQVFFVCVLFLQFLANINLATLSFQLFFSVLISCFLCREYYFLQSVNFEHDFTVAQTEKQTL